MSYCDLCNGKGHVPCPGCKDSGIKERGACVRCEGFGYIRCPACKGTARQSMPKTESEWQELSDLLAREVMGWYLQEGNNPSPNWHDENFEDTGYSLRGPRVYAKGYPRWEPHFNIAHSMLVLKTLLIKAGKHAVARISIRPPPSKCLVTIHNWVATAGAPALLVRSPYVDNEMQAICLAAKEWYNVQTT